MRLLLALSLLRGAASELRPCPVDAQARYANYLNLFALAPDPSSFQTGVVREESSAASLTSAVTSGAPTVVMFYAPWCPHCQSTKLVFDRVAQNFSSGVRFVQIDASGISEVRSPFGVTSYPTIKYFDGTPDALVRAATYAWHGALEDDLRSFVVKQGHPQARPPPTRFHLPPLPIVALSSQCAQRPNPSPCSRTPPRPIQEPPLHATELMALQPAATYSGKDCDCSWVDKSVTACDGEADGTICWRACCHATVSVTPPKAPLIRRPSSQQTSSPKLPQG